MAERGVKMKEWLRLATSRHVVRRALLCALFVGALLIGINHGDALAGGDITARRWLQMLLTVLVPYGVSTVSSVGAMRGGRATHQSD